MTKFMSDLYNACEFGCWTERMGIAKRSHDIRLTGSGMTLIHLTITDSRNEQG